MTAPDPRQLVDGARFPLRLRGYDPADVDDLLDRLQHALEVAAAAAPEPPAVLDALGDPDVVDLRTASRRSFRLVRRGFDPEEVRRYLVGVEGAAAKVVAAEARPTDAAADASAAAADLAAVEAAAVAEAEARAEAVVRDAQDRAQELVRAAEEQAAAVAAEPTPSASRWQELGANVARILERAEAEAAVLVAEGQHRATGHEAAAAADRATAAEELARARRLAVELVAGAEAESARVAAEAEPRVRAHLAEILADGQRQLDAQQADLAAVVAQLRDVERAVDRSLALAAVLPAFGGADRFVAGGDDPWGSADGSVTPLLDKAGVTEPHAPRRPAWFEQASPTFADPAGANGHGSNGRGDPSEGGPAGGVPPAS